MVDTSHWLEARNTEYGFSLRYPPSGYTIENESIDNPLHAVLSLWPSPAALSEKQPLLFVTVETPPKDVDINKYIDMIVSGLNMKVASKETNDLSGTKAVLIKGNVEDSDYGLIFVERRGHFVRITYSTESNSLFFDVLGTIAETLQFINN